MMCLISLHRLYRQQVKKASRFKMTDKKFLEMEAYRLDKVQNERRPLTPTSATMRNPSWKKTVESKPASTQKDGLTHLMKLYRRSSQQQSTVALETIMWNLRRRQVNDSDLLEMLADQRGTAMPPLIPSSNLCRADIEEFNDATRTEITSPMRGCGFV